METRWIEYRKGRQLNLDFVAGFRPATTDEDGPEAKVVLYLTASVDGRKKIIITDPELAGRFLLAVEDDRERPIEPLPMTITLAG